jgi:hypothetical protein
MAPTDEARIATVLTRMTEGTVGTAANLIRLAGGGSSRPLSTSSAPSGLEDVVWTISSELPLPLRNRQWYLSTRSENIIFEPKGRRVGSPFAILLPFSLNENGKQRWKSSVHVYRNRYNCATRAIPYVWNSFLSCAPTVASVADPDIFYSDESADRDPNIYIPHLHMLASGIAELRLRSNISLKVAELRLRMCFLQVAELRLRTQKKVARAHLWIPKFSPSMLARVFLTGTYRHLSSLDWLGLFRPRLLQELVSLHYYLFGSGGSDNHHR